MMRSFIRSDRVPLATAQIALCSDSAEPLQALKRQGQFRIDHGKLLYAKRPRF